MLTSSFGSFFRTATPLPRAPSRCRAVARIGRYVIHAYADPPAVVKPPGDQEPVRESADMSEERDPSAVPARAEHSEVRLDELVEKPDAQEQPRRHPCREDAEQPAYL